MELKLDTLTIKQIFKAVKPIFKENLGAYTHQRISGEWHFRGLAYVRGDMTYVFGFNLGFFKQKGEHHYDRVGMNILVRTNGLNEKLRKKYAEFFKTKLKDWYFKESEYTSFRGGEGVELQRYKKISEFTESKEIVEFLEKGIKELGPIYLKIAENPDNIFDDVLRGAFPWHDSIFDICKRVNRDNNLS
ncbi:MAG: hypothetical protein U9N85_13935 [Bacteroidota bacterium]|nr:hypothetical protein [Bacteroidota bacterium]